MPTPETIEAIVERIVSEKMLEQNKRIRRLENKIKRQNPAPTQKTKAERMAFHQQRVMKKYEIKHAGKPAHNPHYVK